MNIKFERTLLNPVYPLCVSFQSLEPSLFVLIGLGLFATVYNVRKMEQGRGKYTQKTVEMMKHGLSIRLGRK